MNWVDLVIILVVLYFAAEGTRRGFFNQAIDIIGFFVALALSLTFYQQAASFLLNFFNLPKIAANPIGFLAVWILSQAVFFSILRAILPNFLHKLNKLAINRYLGIIPAVLNALLLLSFALLFIISLPIQADIKRQILNSKLGSPLISTAEIAERPLNGIFGPIAKQSLTFLTVTPEEKGSIDLGYTQNQISTDFQDEQKMLALVNEERVKTGAKPLVLDEKRSQVARAHSEDMFKRGYFSHFSPEGKDVGDRLQESGIDYLVAGENLALAPDLVRAHNGLMNSPGHRRNILDPAFGKIGIGVVDGVVYGKMFTQVFTN